MYKVLTGKFGFITNLSILYFSINLAVSNELYSDLFLIPAKASIGDLLLVALKTPPRRMGMYSNFTPVRFSIAGIT